MTQSSWPLEGKELKNEMGVGRLGVSGKTGLFYRTQMGLGQAG